MAALENLASQFAGMTPGGAATLGGSVGGSLSDLGDVAELTKALDAGNYATDVNGMTGGEALRIQSLDTAMKATVQENKHFVLFNKLPSSSATAIVDEYSRQLNIGGFLGGSTNSQLGVVRSASGEYSREVGLVKFLMTLRQVGHILNLGNNLAQPIALEEMNGAKQLLTDAEYLLFYGNSDACPTEFDGIFKQIDDAITAGQVSSDHVISLDGAALKTVEPFSKLNAAVSSYGSWGELTDAFLPVQVQTDLNLHLDPAYRWNSNPNGTQLTLGAHVPGIQLTTGVLKTNIDTFLHYDDFVAAKPFEVTYSALAVANDAYKPTVAVSASSSDAASKFTTSRAGNYYWAVAGIGPSGQGQSTVVKTDQTAVAAGKKAVLTITRSSGGAETGYAIYRSRQDGTNAASDMRLVKIIKCAGATTTFTDLNEDIPGTCKVPMLNLSPGADSICWRSFGPSMQKINLPFGVGGVPVISFFQMMFGYLRLAKVRHTAYCKNILPSTAVWRPHVGE